MTTEIAILDPNQMQAAIDYAERLAYSGLIPDVYQGRPANILWAMEYGRTLGLSTLAAINGVNVIKGKPTASAGLIGALVRRAGHKLRVGYDAATMTGWAEIVRCDDPEFVFRSQWDLERAVEAELCTIKDGRPFAVDSKGNTLPWKKFYPSMVKARATTEVARDACEEVLFGLHYTPEEMGAEVDEDGAPVPQAPREQAAAEQDGPPLATKPQKTKLAILCKEKRGVNERAERLAVVCEVIGREIASSDELTLAEASRAIEILGAEDDFIADAETVPDAPEDVQNRLIALLEQRLDLTDHDDRMRWITGELNRHVATAADLTLPEATGLIERLEATPERAQPWDNQPQVPPPDDDAAPTTAELYAALDHGEPAVAADAAAILVERGLPLQAAAPPPSASWSHRMLEDRGSPLRDDDRARVVAETIDEIAAVETESGLGEIGARVQEAYRAKRLRTADTNLINKAYARRMGELRGRVGADA